ncbi:MAG: DNA-protecting protein DprA [Candidatus Omnitrophica bacterium]|nr:DNA-protecting protein DprA [Candidatus Omnitrophota bacterium]
MMVLSKEQSDFLALSMVDGLGPVAVRRLLKEFGSPEHIFSCTYKDFRFATGLSHEIHSALQNATGSKEFVEEKKYIAENGIGLLTVCDDGYPALLKEIYDPPTILECKGDLVETGMDCIAIVGSRICTSYGMQTAEKLAFDLASNGFTVVSGLARGIDQAAHRGALKAHGRTVAIMGSGFGHIYPANAGALIEDIVHNGAVLTEFHSAVEPSVCTFPRRNRIIAGLCRGCVVVEAAKASGSLITANFALNEGREVFAVPGRIDSPNSFGTNALIQKGAKLVLTADDVLEEMDLMPKKTSVTVSGAIAEPGGRTETGEEILSIFRGGTALHVDEIIEKTGLGIKVLSGALIELECRKELRRVAGCSYVAVKEQGQRA